MIAISNNSRKFTNTEPWASYVQSFQYQLINESKLYLINLINGQASPFSDYVSKVFTAKFESDKLKKEERYDK